MILKSFAFACVVTFTFVPLLAYADISVRNNTKGYATAKTSTSPCSSSIGDGGIIHPESNFTIPQYVLDMYCAFGCDAQVYMTKNCSGRRVATLKVANGKVNRVDNHYVDGYVVSGGGKSLSIDGGPVGMFY